jgi:hypothetical protein
VRLTDVPSVPRKPVGLDVAKARIVVAVRQWLDACEIADWLANDAARGRGRRSNAR